MEKQKVKKAVESSYSKSDVCRKLDIPINGKGIEKVDDLIEKHDLSTEHFDPNKHQKDNRKYPRVEKECPVCGEKFSTRKGHSREKTTCSHSCSNTYFRSGSNNPNWKDDSKTNYRKTAFHALPNECNRCGYDKHKEILRVHHKDRNRANGHRSNLEVLCPTCHEEEHFEANDGRYSD